MRRGPAISNIASRRALLLTALLGMSALAGASAPTPAPLPKPPANGELGFVVSEFTFAIHPGLDDCPDGFAGTVKENFLQTLASPERARLLLKANEPELTQRWKATVAGPNNTNLCTNPELFDRPMQKTVQGTIAPGMNLDGDTAGGASVPGGCGHENFTGMDGTPGVDNQVYRAMGCTRNVRGVDGHGGDSIAGFNALLKTGEHSIVLLLRHVDSLENDPDVEVVIGSTDDRPILDSQRNFITGASFSFSDRNPAWRTVLHGRIAGGVLTTDPADIRLKRPWGQGGIRGARSEWDFRMARMRVAFRPDGSVRGLFAGYQPIRNVILSTILGGYGAAETAGIDCAAEYATLTKLADGLRDPKTGQCTADSVALTIAGVPAFVTDRATSVPKGS